MQKVAEAVASLLNTVENSHYLESTLHNVYRYLNPYKWRGNPGGGIMRTVGSVHACMPLDEFGSGGFQPAK
jgi:hypothetical protein